MRSIIPKNILLSAPHASYEVPKLYVQRLSSEFKQYNFRLLKNFSDYGTKHLLEGVAEDQKILAQFSRAIGDLARSSDSKDLFRECDFNNIPVWSSPLTEQEQQQLLREHYLPFHTSLSTRLTELERMYARVLLLDVHDTGKLLLGSSPDKDVPRPGGFPQINLGVQSNRSCAPELLHLLVTLFKKHFDIVPTIDKPYKGGFITQKYGVEYNATLPIPERFKRSVIQIEFGRYLYLDEATQNIDLEKMSHYRAKFMHLLAELKFD